MSSIPPEVGSLVARLTRNRESYERTACGKQTAIRRRINAPAPKIDQLVCEPSGPTDCEIKIVEEAMQS